jgi:hypothetical protein
MGAFADYIAQIKGEVAGAIPIGGTFFPVSDFTIAPGFLVRGGTFPLPNLEVLADLPYDMLVLDMEVIVSDYTTGEGEEEFNHPRSKYRLIALPEPEGTRVSEIVNYNIADFWELVFEGGGGSDPGADGEKGWSPVIANENDGPTRVVQKVVDWTGGEGDKPVVPVSPNNYIGPLGFTNKTNATNIKGAAGDVSTVQVRPLFYETVGLPGAVSLPLVLTISTLSSAELVIQQISILNNWNQARYFLVIGECSFKEAGGAVYPRVRLRYNTNNNVINSSSPLVNGTMERVDIGDTPPGEFQKIELSHVIQIPAGATHRIGLTAQGLYGEGGYRTNGRIMVIGL